VSKVRRYEVTAAGDFASVLSVLTDHLGLRSLSLDEVERCWLDTSAGTLAARHTSLEFRRPLSDGSPSLLWSEDGRILAADPCVPQLPPSAPPELPATPAFARLAGLLEGSELVASPYVQSHLAVVAALDDEEKTTARVVLDFSQTADGVALPMLLEIIPLRGYESEAAKIEKSLRRKIALTPSDRSMQVNALHGVAPSADATGLDPSMTAAQAWRSVLQQLTDSMTARFPGVLRGEDPEDLHAFRVAVRRIRTILQDGADILEPERRDRFRHDFRWLGDVTTPTRDADVHLIEYPELVAALPPTSSSSLETFLQSLNEHRSICHMAMATELRSAQRAEFASAWFAFLADDGAWSGGGDLADDPAVAVAISRIERAHRQLVKNGRKISKKSPPIALHELRKEGKRLRYLIECFGPLLDKKSLDTVLEPLRDLQDVLGEFQDTEVQSHALFELASMSNLTDDTAARDVVVALVNQLKSRGAHARSSFDKTFRSFDSRSVQRAFDRLAPKPGSQKKTSRKKKR
jgi:CHAD domain-containing protein